MAFQLDVPVLGVIENMSYFVCPDTGKQYNLFGPSHAEEVSKAMGVPFLGHLPIDPQIAILCDAGQIEAYPAEDFVHIADHIARLAPPARQPRPPQCPAASMGQSLQND